MGAEQSGAGKRADAEVAGSTGTMFTHWGDETSVAAIRLIPKPRK